MASVPFSKGPMDDRRWSDGPSRTWGQAWETLESNDAHLPTVHWCMDLRLGGTRLRIGTGKVALRAVTGQTMAFTAGLSEDLEIDDQYTPGQSAGARSVSISVPNRLVCAQSQITAGHVLAGGVEISLASDGMAWEDRVVVMNGDVTGGVSWGSPQGSNVRLTASDPRETAGLPVTPYM